MISAYRSTSLWNTNSSSIRWVERSKKKRIGGVKKPLNTLAECLSVTRQEATSAFPMVDKAGTIMMCQ